MLAELWSHDLTDPILKILHIFIENVSGRGSRLKEIKKWGTNPSNVYHVLVLVYNLFMSIFNFSLCLCLSVCFSSFAFMVCTEWVQLVLTPHNNSFHLGFRILETLGSVLFFCYRHLEMQVTPSALGMKSL